MKTISMVALAACAAFAAATQSTPAQKIGLIYSRLDALTLKKDAVGVNKLLQENSTKDCIFTQPKSKNQSISDVINSVTMEFASVDKVNESKSNIYKTVVNGDKVVVFVDQILGVKTNTKTPDGKVHEIMEKSRSEDTWVKVGSAWKLKLSKVTKLTTTQDGKPMPAGG